MKTLGTKTGLITKTGGITGGTGDCTDGIIPKIEGGGEVMITGGDGI